MLGHEALHSWTHLFVYQGFVYMLQSSRFYLSCKKETEFKNFNFNLRTSRSVH